MAVTPDMNKVAVVMSQLQHNYSQLAQNWFNIFYNPEPQDVIITFFDELGNYETYTVPNRAKDFNNIKNGSGSPEGAIKGGKGTIYQDLTNGDAYLKKAGDDKIGWVKIITQTEIEHLVRKGDGDPNGNVVGEKGDLYVDRATGNLYIKTTDTGNQGWVPAISTDYATHAEVTSAVATSAATKANKDFSNLDSSAEKHFLNKGQISNCILEAPEGVAFASNTAIQIKKNLKLLFADGINDGVGGDGTLNNLEFTTSEENIFTTPITVPTINVVYFLTYVDEVLGIKCLESTRVFYQDLQPIQPAVGLTAIWFSPKDNLWRITENNTAWTSILACRILSCDHITGGVISNPVYEKPVSLFKMEDTRYLKNDIEVINLSGNEVTLSDNKAHVLNVTEDTEIKLPTIYNKSRFHQMVVLVKMPVAYSLDLGTTHYFNNSEPYMDSIGEYTLIYEYDGLNWVVGSLYKGE